MSDRTDFKSTAPVYFIRHGQTDWNVETRLQGQADIDINDTGRAQATANGRRLAGLIDDPESFDYVASPMRRTRETMEIVRQELGLPREGYRLDPRLLEVHFGDWQGYTFDELERVHPGASGERNRDKWRFVPPGEKGESYAMLAERVRPWLNALDRPTVCVTHGGVIRALFVLTGNATQGEAQDLHIAQDRVLAMKAGRLEWI
ncbi:histidine phosphatase family protein [Mesorhizobium xinjiangense]|uniref:histidine phosphatase family protein n=1 Tax=Mesorhizobium xinjiangense TaxID=2678685 RepID=UPI0012ED04CE|nr:histidine phosphatase family protein [Mesorhizobium xinjiangense]